MNSNSILFIMGVSGAGKSTIGKLVSQDLDIPYYDGDDFHSEENISKMSNGISLNDQDRSGWLVSINQFAKDQLATNSCIIACSALKEKYRNILSEGIKSRTKWVYLYGTFEQIAERIKSRSDHFMTTDLLRSQFDTLEGPMDALDINVSLSLEEIVETIRKEIFIPKN